VQNNAEGSQALVTSKKIEIKLTQVARAILEELKLDYEDFLRQRGLATLEPDRSPHADPLQVAQAANGRGVCGTGWKVSGKEAPATRDTCALPSGDIGEIPYECL